MNFPCLSNETNVTPSPSVWSGDVLSFCLRPSDCVVRMRLWCTAANILVCILRSENLTLLSGWFFGLQCRSKLHWKLMILIRTRHRLKQPFLTDSRCCFFSRDKVWSNIGWTDWCLHVYTMDLTVFAKRCVQRSGLLWNKTDGITKNDIAQNLQK